MPAWFHNLTPETRRAPSAGYIKTGHWDCKQPKLFSSIFKFLSFDIRYPFYIVDYSRHFSFVILDEGQLRTIGCDHFCTLTNHREATRIVLTNHNQQHKFHNLTPETRRAPSAGYIKTGHWDLSPAIRRGRAAAPTTLLDFGDVPTRTTPIRACAPKANSHQSTSGAVC